MCIHVVGEDHHYTTNHFITNTFPQLAVAQDTLIIVVILYMFSQTYWQQK